MNSRATHPARYKKIAFMSSLFACSIAAGVDVKTAIARQTLSEPGSDGTTRIEVVVVTIVKHPELLALRAVTTPAGIRWLGERSNTDNADCRADAAAGSNCRQSHLLVFESAKRCLPTSGYGLNWDVSCAAGKTCSPGSTRHETLLRLQLPSGC